MPSTSVTFIVESIQELWVATLKKKLVKVQAYHFMFMSFYFEVHIMDLNLDFQGTKHSSFLQHCSESAQYRHTVSHSTVQYSAV